jgi:hypothetical protein
MPPSRVSQGTIHQNAAMRLGMEGAFNGRGGSRRSSRRHPGTREVPLAPIGQVPQPFRATRLRIASARANTVLAVGHVSSSKVVARIDRISRATRTHGSRYGSWFTRSPGLARSHQRASTGEWLWAPAPACSGTRGAFLLIAGSGAA